MDLSRRGALIAAALLGLGACAPPDVNRAPGHTATPPMSDPDPEWARVEATGWKPQDAVWRNGTKYFREVEGRATLETSTNYLARDRFNLLGGLAPTASVDRSEYSARERLEYDREYWCSYGLKVHFAEPTSWFLLNQFHDVPNMGAATLPPPFAAVLVPGSNSLEIIARAAGAQRRRMTEAVVYRAENFERGRWHQFVYSVTFTRGEGGYVSIWHDGAKGADGEVDLGFPDKIGPYFKFGAYRDPTPGDALVEYANVEVAQQSLRRRVDEPEPLRVAFDLT